MTKFFIDQHGCAKNQTDGELLVGFLVKNGFSLTLNPEEADVILINSCGFIESAKKESIDAVYDIHKAYPAAKIIMTGCLAERYASELLENMNELDGVFGNGNLSKIVEFMNKIEKGERSEEVFSQNGVCCGDRPVLFNYPGSAFVKITEGCSNHCSFCAIPLIRGELRSRPMNDIISEIQALINDGIYEINLIGQDLAAYGTEAGFISEGSNSAAGFTIASGKTTEASPLSILLSKISDLKGDFLIRLLYIHPDHFNTDILPVIKNDSRFARYFDIPFQSGDDKIILAMNRVGSSEEYIRLIEKIREVLPDAVIRTTFLTGFPGETEENAKNTQDFLCKIKPDWSGTFSYSREEDTPAYSFKHKVPEAKAAKRAEKLQKIQQKISEEKLNSYIGKEVNVLIEEVIESGQEGLAIGRAWFQAPDVDGNVVVRYDLDEEEQVQAVKAGNVVKARIIACTGIDLDASFEKLIRKNINNFSRKFIF